VLNDLRRAELKKRVVFEEGNALITELKTIETKEKETIKRGEYDATVRRNRKLNVRLLNKALIAS